MTCSDLELSLRTGASVNSISPQRKKWRSYLSQILASTIKNFLLFDLGLAVAFPTIVIPALQYKDPIVATNGTGLVLDIEVDARVESFFLTAEQITWFGSIAFICQPLGGVMSGWITEPFGRKKAMFLVNIPFVAAWIMMYSAGSTMQVLIADVLMGIGVGFMEAAVLTYVGEIAEPAIRGLLTSCASLSVTLGVFVTYFLGSVVYWRTAALICLSVPVVTAIAICFVPETPLWLLSQGRREDAIKSLQWLRGWTTEEAVAEEFNAIEQHHKATDICAACNRRNVAVCEHSKSSFGNRVQELFTSATMKPFFIIVICSLFGHLSGVSSIRQYYVQIYETYDVPMNAKTATVLSGFVGLFGNIFLLLVLKKVGKRKICLISFLAMGACGVALGFYAINVFAPGQTSFANREIVREGKGLIPLIIFFAYSFLFNFGVNAIPWMLLSEIFPFKCVKRGDNN